jgi:hypothetical protein
VNVGIHAKKGGIFVLKIEHFIQVKHYFRADAKHRDQPVPRDHQNNLS